ncbi:NUDIX domain-containing protein [Pseudodesulfovibrio sp. F-1]|uniref:NUDIX domain-containing protein n=1 Tax=Pseudodesulfovibrio alkaliphilus TaxID=2661613 RepID=A0A7K1KQT8_9BACT|nr:NUDIX domain-containing protein [Pseudodesulfovibrio alkaliphilus]MUM78272.1 NUDIX domain-containing protein [Pseudodesulfovibrio alkaliphilus]
MIFSKKSSARIDPARFVEVVDGNNRPLAVLDKDMAHRQLLRHRSVQVLVFNTDKKIYLQKRSANKRFFPGRWDISARTHPHVSEASADAALRVLREELNLTVEHTQFVRTLPACAETGFEHISIYTLPRNTQPITPNSDEVSEGYHFSREELTCLVKEFRELLTPNLVTLWEAGLLVSV